MMNRILTASALAIVALTSSAQAGLTFYCNIAATSSSGTANWTSAATPVFDANGVATWVWEPVGGRNMVDSSNGNTVATIRSVNATYVADPIVNLGFFVQAGSIDTTFTITSGILSFSPITSPVARATAGLTLTDGDANDTASLIGGFSGGHAYQAYVNAINSGNLGSVFAALLAFPGSGPLTTLNTQTAASTAGFPSYLPVGTTAFSMASQFSFTLSANDLASGTSSFVLIPGPGAAALLGMGMVVVGRRRR
jgi:uncharacterized protein (TIGR03382 family)